MGKKQYRRAQGEITMKIYVVLVEKEENRGICSIVKAFEDMDEAYGFVHGKETDYRWHTVEEVDFVPKENPNES